MLHTNHSVSSEAGTKAKKRWTVQVDSSLTSLLQKPREIFREHQQITVVDSGGPPNFLPKGAGESFPLVKQQ
jgi:hypothetical protein